MRFISTNADTLDAVEGNSLMNAIRACDPKKHTRLADKTPPESETRSCIYRGNLETWENQIVSLYTKAEEWATALTKRLASFRVYVF